MTSTTDAPFTVSPRQIRLMFTGIVAGMSLSALDGTIVNTALATIVGDLGGVKSYAWVGTAYMLTSTASTPLFGKLSDLYGRRALFQTAIIMFTLASVFCGLAQNMWQLVLARGLQGIGGGGLFALSFTIIGDVVSPRDRGRYVGVITSIFTVTSVIGPLIGGFIVDNMSWRWIFYVNIPIGIAAMIITDRALRLPFPRHQRKVDVVGAALLVASVSCLILGLAWTSEDYGWLHPSTIGLFLATVILGAVFVRWEETVDEPIMPLSMLRIDVVRTVVPMMFLVGAVFYGANAFTPLYLQSVTGVSATNSGLLLVPLAVAVAFSATYVGRRTSRTGSYKWWPLVGTIVTLLALLVLSTLGPTRGYLYVAMSGAALLGLGLGAIMPTGTLAVQNAVPPHEMGAGSSFVLFMRSLGGAIGLAAYGAVFNSRISGRIDPELVRQPRVISKLPSPDKEQALEVLSSAIHTVFRAAVPVMIIAILIAYRVPARPLRTTSAMADMSAADGGAGASTGH